MTGLVGTGTLARLALRRDRIRLAVWTPLAIGLAAGPAASIKDAYASHADRQRYAETIGGNPAAAVFSGPSFGVDTLGGIIVKEVGAWTVILVALASMMMVIRHTRTEEETGRAELVRSAVVGRYAQLAAALLVVCAADAVIGAGVFAAMLGAGLPAAGSLAFGLAVTLTGWVFAGVAGVVAQLAEHARTANGSASAVFGLAFILRGIGDSSYIANDGGGVLQHLSWVSPAGWLYQVRPYAGERWWVLGLSAITAGILVWTAVALSFRRDVGAGLVPARLGRPGAAPGLASPWALAWRLQRGTLIGWSAGVAVGAGVLGALAYDITDMTGDNAIAAKAINQLGGAGALVDSYLVWVLRIMGLAAAAYAVGAILRLRSEESGLRAEPVLATAVTRVRWATNHLAVAIIGTAVLLMTAGLVIGVVHGLRTGDVGAELPRVLGGAVVQLPAALVPAALAVALFGAAPRLTAVAWGFVVVVLLVAQLGPVLQLDQWAMEVSPFTHLPRVPGGNITGMPLVWLTAIATVLAAVGLLGFRRRDINTA